MREILFRGKRMDNGEWVEGDLWNGKSALVYARDGCPGGPSWNEVDPATVGQFTGLLDKNGKRIFEGDIVKDGYGGRVAVVEAEIWNCGCCYSVFGFSTETNDPGIDDTIVVVGNIHDNPKLL